LNRVLELLNEVVCNGGSLRNVREILFDSDSQAIMGVELQFDALTIALSAVADDDTVAVVAGTLDGLSRQPTSSLWTPCIGKPLRWAWLLTNQLGYVDGIRLEFSYPDDPQSVIVELVTVASIFRVYRVKSLDA
jgi:hypothetical protein